MVGRQFFYNPDDLSVNETVKTLHKISNSLKTADLDEINKLCEKFEMTSYDQFENNMKVIFRDKTNWGRIAIFYIFGAKLADRYKKEGSIEIAETIIDNFIRFSRHFENWIVSVGGWEAFRREYGNNNNLLCYAGFLLAFGVGALFFQHRS